MPFDPVDPKQSFPSLEEGILTYWREEDTFKRSMDRRKDGEIFSFYDGPPFATGVPHYGHILAGTIKDVIPRYQTMRGKFVERRFGWDCHGLPIENLIEKEQNISSKRDIEAMGVATFNRHCRNAVQRYTKEWRDVVERLGRWVDMDWDYRTMDPEYMESIWWVFKSLYDQGLIYEGHKPMHICPRCATPLSNFEVTQGYKDVQDSSVYVKLELVDEPGTFLLIWTTTAWTLPGNVLAAINPAFEYVKVKHKNELYILAKERVQNVFNKEEYEIVGSLASTDILGRKYTPLFPYFVDRVGEKGFTVVEAPFVTLDAGTGVVHEAPAFGEDDFYLGQKIGVPLIQHVGIDGCFTSDVTDFAGLEAKPKENPSATDRLIADVLKKQGKLFQMQTINHSYPHCWRCDAPLLNYATSSWFVAVEKIKAKMLEANGKTHWVPDHLRDGRFGKWLEGARDWAISRNRYWGCPLPIWRDPVTQKMEVLGSRDDLMLRTKERFTKVTVMRHAESEGNVQQIYQGQVPGTSLTERGRGQAKTLAERLAEDRKRGRLAPTIIYCSPLARTQETASIVAKELGATLVVDERLREVNFGEYEGKHIDFDDLTFIRERRAHKLQTGQIESIYHFHGMETWPSIEKRIQAFLDEILPKHRGESIGIVTHADLAMNFLHAFTGMDPHKIVHRPYPDLASSSTYFWDHVSQSSMDLHKETVDDISWLGDTKRSVDLTLVRHGETAMNKKGLVQGGEGNEPLNAQGKKQAKATAASLKNEQYDAIICSDLSRAVETATIIATELGMTVTTSNPLLRERMLGETTGQPIERIMKEFNAPAHAKGTVFLRSAPKGGETLDQFLSRMQRAYDWLLKEYSGKRILVVGHSGVLRAFQVLAAGKTIDEAMSYIPTNAGAEHHVLTPRLRRIPEVLDCWFESGSMPYAQSHFPFEGSAHAPHGFPADFIAEGLDQTRGWFYTLMVLSTALFQCPPFRHCVVNGIVLAEDGKKMSKRLKNYPEPTEVVKKHGADAVRFALMSSPAVRAEDLRFSEKCVEDVVRTLLLPLWNSYRLFVTYANGAMEESQWKPSLEYSLKNAASKDLLDRWIVSKTQLLVNEMTQELENYDLRATCQHLTNSIDDLTNWYIRLSRRRLAGKEGTEAQHAALDTLYRILLSNCQLLAPFCPFITEDIFLNLVGENHDSIHFSDWPATLSIAEDDMTTMTLMDATRTVVTLGLSLRSDAKIKVRQPIASVSIALPPSHTTGVLKELIAEELNVKRVIEVTDPTTLASAIALVDARKVGPRVGGKVQELIKAGKSGQFTTNPDGTMTILDVVLTHEEAKIVYQSKEGMTVAAEHGIVVAIETTLSPELIQEGQARELIHAIQQLRKDAGLEFTDTITLALQGADDLQTFEELILRETRAVKGVIKKKGVAVDVGEGRIIEVKFEKN